MDTDAHFSSKPKPSATPLGATTRRQPQAARSNPDEPRGGNNTDAQPPANKPEAKHKQKVRIPLKALVWVLDKLKEKQTARA